MISETYTREWRTGPDEPRVQLELEYRRRALERDAPRPAHERPRIRRTFRGILDACARMRRALPWAA